MVILKAHQNLVAFFCIAFCPLIHAEVAVPSTYRLVADHHGVPVMLLYAIALTESGMRMESHRGLRPWPWTLNIDGRAHYFKTRWQAWRALDESLRSGQNSVDVGLMQVNWRFHGERLGNSWLALEPQHNLTVGAQILKDCYLRRRNWWASVGCYHAPSDIRRAKRYRARVTKHWRELTGVN